MNAYLILNFVHDEDNFLPYILCINFLYYLFEFLLYCIMLLLQQCNNAYVRKLTPRQVIIPWAVC